jgi:hypothetical protein
VSLTCCAGAVWETQNNVLYTLVCFLSHLPTLNHFQPPDYCHLFLTPKISSCLMARPSTLDGDVAHHIIFELTTTPGQMHTGRAVVNTLEYHLCALVG